MQKNHISKCIFLLWNLRYDEAAKAFEEASEAVDWSNQTSDKKEKISQDLINQKVNAQKHLSSSEGKAKLVKGKNQIILVFKFS